MNKQWCAYYTGHVKKEKAWMLTAVLRGAENVAFDRTLNVKESIFEFFVPEDMENIFLQAAEYLKKQDVLLTLVKEKNRFASL